ncbi:uncharacterized protein ACLA_032340 [Aspergillus clavatus NRRL 1]|uniref:Uncharacterized protein n=1 Tax=Aspergillus clavatus (strain ATCC 1007 / CBS 513.65 / DSM 816 / NCTC 3887 / NRRL 1 / QM 1276 / 107) TaxID=344612 RepID=A1CS78_ASPCL|nr:uncharacterized protein ACLA_032340 [Aspergillus clavatus NRRL 1]EAW08499.1 conserved hypothetical protein [Aspergillus clavatus NRRL 1]
MPSSSSEIVRRDEQLAELTELATRLERIFTKQKNDRECLFFAGILLHILTHSKTDIDSIWHSIDTEHNTLLVNCLKAHPEDLVLFFQYYESERRRVGVVLLTSCQLVQSSKDNCEVLAQGTIVALVGTETLTFIHIITRRSTAGYQFFLISVQSSLRYARRLKQSTNGEISQLILHFDAEASVSLNGKRQGLGASTLSLTSPDDLTDLQTVIEIAGKEFNRQSTELSSLTSLTRKTSSIVISLDSEEEITAKSSNHEYLLSGPKEHYFLRSSASITRLDKPVSDRTVGYDSRSGTAVPHAGASHLDGSSQVPKGDRPSEKELVEQPTASEPPIESGRKSLSENDGENLLTAYNFEESAMHSHKEPSGWKPTDTKSVTVTDDGLLKSQDHHIEVLNSKDAKELSVEGNLNMQDKKQQRRKIRASKSSGRALGPDTQESLIFPMRNSARKKYTHSRGTIDWDEDLRPSDDAKGPSSQKDPEVTSVSSPLPGERSFFDRNQKKVGAKRKPKADTLARKRRKSSQAKNGGKEAHYCPQYGAERLNLAQNSRPKDIKGPTDRRKCQDGSKRLEECLATEIAVPEEENKSQPENSTNNAPDNGLVANTDVSGVEMNIAFLSDEAKDMGYLLAYKSLREHYSGNRDGHSNESIASNMKPALRSDKELTGGKAFGQNLAAGFHDSSSHSSRHLVPNAARNSPAAHGKIEHEEQGSQENADNKGQDDEIAQHTNSAAYAKKTLSPNDSRCKASAPPVINVNIISSDGRAVQGHQPSRSQGSTGMIENNKSRKRRSVNVESDNPSRKRSWHDEPSLIKECVPQGQSDMQISRNHNSSITKNSKIACHRPGVTGLRDGVLSVAEGRHISHQQARNSESKAMTASQKADSLDSTDHSVFRVTASLDPTPRKTIVDRNGSPRLVLQHITRGYSPDETAFDFNHGYEQSTQIGVSRVQREVIESGCEADLDQVVEQGSFKDSPKISCFHDKLEACRRDTLPTKWETGSHQVPLGKEKTPSEKCAAKGHIITSSGDVFTLYFPTLPPPKEPKSLQTNRDELAPSSSEGNLYPTHSSSESDERSSWSELPEHDYVQKPIQSLQEKPHDVLLVTNENLLRELDRERATFSKVLDAYRQQYYQVLDQLFARQEERIRLCRQHMKTIKKHHTDLCQELLHRLQESEQRLTKNAGQGDSSPNFEKSTCRSHECVPVCRSATSKGPGMN